MERQISLQEFSTLKTYDWIIKLTNCYILKERHLVKEDLLLQNGRILDGIFLFYVQKKKADVVIDLDGNVISPGFIDIQVNGGYGVDFSKIDANIQEVCDKIALNLLSTGVTSFCPTIITSPQQLYKDLVTKFRNYKPKPGQAEMLGLHFEGPFISRTRAGMHPSELMVDFGSKPEEAIKVVYGDDLGLIKIITVAPELPGALEAILHLVANNIIVSIGHTNADGDEVDRAIFAGATLVTHLFNAMPVFHHRGSHILGSLSKPVPEVYVGIIADLVHTSPSALRLAEAVAPGRIVLVTDSNRAFEQPDGIYEFGGQSIQVENKLAYIRGTNLLAGGTTPMYICVLNYWTEVTRYKAIKAKDCCQWPGLGEALAIASETPAKSLRLYQPNGNTTAGPNLRKGSLQPGADADLVILRPITTEANIPGKLQVLSTWVSGVPAYVDPQFACSVQISSK